MTRNVPRETHEELFIDHLKDLLDAEGGIDHAHVPRRGADKGRPVRFTSLRECAERYEWRNGTLESTWSGLQELRTGLRDAVDANDGPGSLEAGGRILEWGGVTHSNLAKLREDYGERSCRLPDALRDATNELHAEDPDFTRFGREEGRWRMNSGFTKLYALLGENGVIYDSRVAAGLGYLVADWCAEKQYRSVPRALALRHVPAKGEVNRDPSRPDEGLLFSKVNVPHQWARSNALANRLLDSAVERAGGFAGATGPEALWRLEAALFVLGYDLGQRASGPGRAGRAPLVETHGPSVRKSATTSGRAGNASLGDRFRGALVGLAAGDAVGTTVEFEYRGTFEPLTDMVGGGPFDLEPGQWTDDTSMALCLATSLVERGGFDAADQMRRYVRWRDEGYLSSTGECFDIGNTVGAALHRFDRDGEPFAGSTEPDTAGNGSLMRLAPAVLFGWPDLDAMRRLARESSRTTHGAPECLDACELMAVLMHRALSGATKAEILTPVALEDPTDAMRAVADMTFIDKHVDEIVGSGYVVAALEAALWCFAREQTFEAAILAAANLGYDADTTAAICGQLAGAHHGLAGIPAGWVERLAMRVEIVALADALGGGRGRTKPVA